MTDTLHLPPARGENELRMAAAEVPGGGWGVQAKRAAGERGSARREPRAVDDQALMGTGADDAAGSLDLHLEAEQAPLSDFHQTDAHGHVFADTGGTDVADGDVGADGGLAVTEAGVYGGEAGVLD